MIEARSFPEKTTSPSCMPVFGLPSCIIIPWQFEIDETLSGFASIKMIFIWGDEGLVELRNHWKRMRELQCLIKYGVALASKGGWKLLRLKACGHNSENYGT